MRRILLLLALLALPLPALAQVADTATLIVVPMITRVDISPSSARISGGPGKTQKFTAIAYDETGAIVAGVKWQWSVADPTVATIDSTGLARVVGHGTTKVMASPAPDSAYLISGIAPDSVTGAVLGARNTFTHPYHTAVVNFVALGETMETCGFYWYADTPVLVQASSAAACASWYQQRGIILRVAQAGRPDGYAPPSGVVGTLAAR